MMQSFTRHLLLASALAGGVLAAALPGPDGSAGAQSLAEALATAYGTNPGLDSSRRAVLAGDEEVAIACGGYRPSLIARGSTEALAFDSEFSNNTSNSDSVLSNEVALGLEQNVYRGGGTVAQVRGARSFLETQRAVLDNSRQQLFVDTITAYANVLRDETVRESAEANVGRFEQQLDATDRRLRVGEATRTDRSQALARLALAQAELSQAVANLETSRGNFLAVVGVPPATLETIGPPEALPATLDEAMALVDENPAVRAAAARLAQVEANIDAAGAQLLPRVDLRGEVAYQHEPSPVVDNNSEARFGVFVQVPLYQGGAEYAQVRQQRQLEMQRRQELNDARRQVGDEINRAYRQYQASGERVERFQEQVAAETQALDGVIREVQVGTRLIVDILDQQQALFVAEVNLERAVRDRVVAGYEYLAAIGDLSPTRLEVDTGEADARLARVGGDCRLFDIGRSID